MAKKKTAKKVTNLRKSTKKTPVRATLDKIADEVKTIGKDMAALGADRQSAVMNVIASGAAKVAAATKSVATKAKKRAATKKAAVKKGK